jgi:hypothetical protein
VQDQQLSPFPDAWILLSISVVEGMAELAPYKCCWRNSGAVFRTAPFLSENVAQFLMSCASSRWARRSRELRKTGCACVSDIGASGQEEPESSICDWQLLANSVENPLGNFALRKLASGIEI